MSDMTDQIIYAEPEKLKRTSKKKFKPVLSKKKPLFNKVIHSSGANISMDMLSECQLEALEKMKSFVVSKEQEMVFAGYAGTGKTTTLKFLLDYLDETTYRVIVTAPTNEAVRVISKQAGRDYGMTIYSILGLALYQDDDTSPYIKQVGESKLNEYDIVILDETSMINQSIYNLIKSAMKEFSHIKFIFVGDPAQLPPVNDPNGISPTFLIPQTHWAFIDKIQRVAEGNPIITLVTSIRNNLAASHDHFSKENKLDECGNGIHFINSNDEFHNMMFSHFSNISYNNDPNFVRVLAYTNKAVNEENILIRRHLYGPSVAEFVPSEIVLVAEPIMDESGFNVMFTVGERLRIESTELKTDRILGFKYWSLDVINYEAPQHERRRETINVIHSTYISQYRTELSNLANNAKKLIEFNPSNKKTAWIPYFEFKKRFSWLRYIYATTVHCSQGSTFDNAFILNNDMNILQWNHVERNKLKYVAFTRAKHNIFVL
jgi:exodeoxyribonuclease-5